MVCIPKAAEGPRRLSPLHCRRKHGARWCAIIYPSTALAWGQSMADLDFDTRQHEFLRTEIQTAEVEARTLERYAMIGLSALWAWTVKETPGNAVLVGFISLVIGLLGGLRMWALWNHMSAKAAYVAEIEKLKSDKALGGWERFYRSLHGKGSDTPLKEVAAAIRKKHLRRPSWIGYTSAAFWLAIFVASVPFGCYVSTHASKSSSAGQILCTECAIAPEHSVK
jgi:hypothetical protein